MGFGRCMLISRAGRDTRQMRTYLERRLADGTTLIEHYEYDRVVATTHVERLPGGKVPKRQLQGIAIKASQDFEAFYLYTYDAWSVLTGISVSY